MRMKPISSSNIEEVGYDEATSRLRVKFRNGSLYEYRDVPADVAAGLESAESPGRYFSKNIRNASFPTTRVEEGSQ